MTQINIQTNRDFEKELKTYMKLKGISNKSEAIRCAVAEAAQRSKQVRHSVNFHSWIGLALKVPPVSMPSLEEHDELWSV